MKHPFISFLAACIAALLVTACEKDDPVPPEYAGTWSTSWSYLDEGDTIDVKDVLNLGEDTYEEIIRIRNRTYMSTQSDYLGMSGALSVSGYTMSISINKVGISAADENGMPAGNLLWFSKGEQDYYELISGLGLVEVFNADFSIAGNVLTLLVDSNRDGDFLDAGEATIYGKE